MGFVQRGTFTLELLIGIRDATSVYAWFLFASHPLIRRTYRILDSFILNTETADLFRSIKFRPEH